MWEIDHNHSVMVVFDLPYTITQLKKESKLKEFFETSDNLFDSGQSITGLGNKSRKLTESQKKNKKLRERIEQEKDKDIQAELRKGNTVQL
jgi:hypothetical protein